MFGIASAVARADASSSCDVFIYLLSPAGSKSVGNAAEPTLAAIRNVIGRTRAVTTSVRRNPLGSGERSSDRPIYRQWSRTTEDKSGETGEIEAVQFIARRPELRAGRR